MADSDSDDGDPVTNELEVFQDEIKSTITRSLGDATTFRSLIAEAENLRNAYKQDHSSLNKAVLKSLFELPFNTISQAMTFTAYFGRMNKNFEQYSPLIKSLKRDKKMQQEGGIAVADPLIQLMSSGKLSSDEWIQGKAKAELGTLLIQHGVIAESQVAVAINTIDGVFRTEEPATPEGAGTSSELAGRSEFTSRPLKRKHELCTGQFSGIFTHTGGKLHHWMSDDYLEIPKGAIPEGQEWKITGNIYTSLDDYTKLLKKPKSEAFVAAINDYEVEGGHWFEVPVKVVIHHSISDPMEFENLCIRLHDKEHDFIEVPKRAMNGAGGKGPWYEVDGPRIVVYTYHFTKVICSCKKEVNPDTECSVGAVKVHLYGKMTQETGNSYCATIELYVHALKDVERLPVFREAFIKDQEDSGFRLLKSKPFPPALQQITPADKISTGLSFISKDWTILQGSDELRPKLVGDYVPCLAQAYDPVNVFTFMLHGKGSCINGMVDFSLGQSSVKLPLQMQFVPPTSAPSQATTATIASLASFQAAIENQAAGPSGVAQISEDVITLSDTRLYAIAEKLISETRADVGIKLGLSRDELDILLQSNNNNQTERRTSLDMLLLWYERQPLGSNYDLTRSASTLRRVLQETNNTAALAELEGPTRAVQVALTDSNAADSQTTD